MGTTLSKFWGLIVCDMIGASKAPVSVYNILTELTNQSAETHTEGLAPFQWSHFLQLLQLNRLRDPSVRFQAETFLYPVSDKNFVFNNIASAKNLGPLATLGGCDHPEDNEVQRRWAHGHSGFAHSTVYRPCLCARPRC